MSSPDSSGAPPSQRGQGRRPSPSLLIGLALLATVAACLEIAFELGKPVKIFEPAVAVDRPIHGGQTHRYSFELASGDFLRIRVDQRTPDLVVRLLDPAKEEVLAVDDPNSQSEDEDLSAVVERSGSYVVEISPLERNAARGSYSLLAIDGPRPATKGDLWRAEATALTQESDDLHYLRPGPEAWKREVELREKALDLWHRTGDRRREARMLRTLGQVFMDLQSYERASSSFQASAEIFEELEDFSQCANSLNGSGRAERRLLRDEAALRHFQQALELSQVGTEVEVEVDILSNLGNLWTELGDPEKAIAHLQRGLLLAGTSNRARAGLLNNLGHAYRLRGDYQEAKASFEKGLRLIRGSDPEKESALLSNLGGIERVLGNWGQAIQYYERALEIQPKDSKLLASLHNNLAFAYQRTGKPAKAFGHYQEALETTADAELRVKALNNMSLLELRQGRPAEAVRYSRKALQVARSTRAPARFEAPVLESLGRAQTELGETQAARENLQKTLLIVRGLKDQDGEAAVTLALAETERKAGNLETALEHARAALAMVESLRTRVTDQDLRATFLGTKLDYYEVYIDILMDLHRAHPAEGYDARALHANEMARARSLLEILGDAEGDPSGRSKEVNARRLQAEVREREEAYQKRQEGGASPESLAGSAVRLEEARERYRRFLSGYQPRFAALIKEPLDLKSIQDQVLGSDTLLLEYALGTKRSHLWAVTKGSIFSYELPPRSEIEELARSFYGHVIARDLSANREAAELSRILLTPVEALLGDQTLLVVGDGALQYIPFAALPLPSSPAGARKPLRVIRRHRVVSLPSASVLAALRRKLDPRPAPPKTLAVFADPVFNRDDDRWPRPEPEVRLGSLFSPSSDRAEAGRAASPPETLPRLRYAEREANEILALVPPDRRLEARGFDASKQRVESAPLDQYRFVHFATHGYLNNERPELSSLILSLFDETGRKRDGHLRLLNIYNLQLNADLVVLSACETALGREIRGEGLVGLTRGFMDAGSKRVLSSLWKVDDRWTAKLMGRLYDHLLNKGESASEALRQAQLELEKDEQTEFPYYWAGFSLQGEWR